MMEQTMVLNGEIVTENDLALMSVPAFAQTISEMNFRPTSAIILFSGVYHTIRIDGHEYTPSKTSWKRAKRLCANLWREHKAEIEFYQGGCAYLVQRPF